jgi:hypothetical protein
MDGGLMLNSRGAVVTVTEQFAVFKAESVTRTVREPAVKKVTTLPATVPAPEGMIE